jgi:hypothetical protein
LAGMHVRPISESRDDISLEPVAQVGFLNKETGKYAPDLAVTHRCISDLGRNCNLLSYVDIVRIFDNVSIRFINLRPL